MLHFPQGRTYTFYHGLGKIPLAAPVYVSFCEQLIPGGNDDCISKSNNVAQASGNLALYEEWDEEKITIRNDTCENNFYMRVVIFADEDATTSNEGGATGEGGTAANDTSN